MGSPAAVVSVTIGSVCLLVTAQLSGTGLGLLLRRRLVAFLGTVILPLGVWLLLGAIGPITFLRPWLTPFGAASPLLTDTASQQNVPQDQGDHPRREVGGVRRHQPEVRGGRGR